MYYFIFAKRFVFEISGNAAIKLVRYLIFDEFSHTIKSSQREVFTRNVLIEQNVVIMIGKLKSRSSNDLVAKFTQAFRYSLKRNTHFKHENYTLVSLLSIYINI